MSSGNKEDYEKVPDVELGANGDAPAAPAASYSELPDNQASLMSNFDAAASTANLGFEMPAADPSELAAQGQSMIMSMLTPTITAVTAMAAGMWLNYESQYSAVAGVLVLAFPYINATLQFASSIKPLQDRLYSAVEPIFAKKEKAEAEVTEGFEGITRKVDKTVDALQAQVGEVLDPLKPTLDQASAQAEPLKRLDPDLDIPDVGDIDEEFDEAQGKVGDRVEEARNQFSNVNQYLPAPFHSANNFYWKIIFPVLLTALLLQLAIAFITTYSSQQKEAAATSTVTDRRHLRGGSTWNRALLDIADASAAVPVDAVSAQVSEGVQDAQQEASAQVDAAKAAAGEQVDAAKAEATAQVDAAKAAAGEQVDAAKEQVTEQVDAAKAEATAQVDAAKEQVTEQVHAAKAAAGEQVDAAKDAAGEQIAAVQGQVDDAKAEAAAQVDAAKEQVTAQVDAAKAAAGEQIAAVQGQVDAAKEQVTAQVDAAKAAAQEKLDAAKEQVDAAKAEAAAQVDAAKAKVAAQVDAAKEQLEAGKQQLETSKAEAEAEVAAAKLKMEKEGKTILISTITSWILSLLQMGLVFLFTSPKVKAWVINQMVTQAQDEANRRLRATGVPDMLHDVLVVRMGRIKAKLYKVFSVFGRIEKVMEKLKGFSEIPGVGKAADKVSGAMSGVMGSLSGDSKKLSFGGFGRK